MLSRGCILLSLQCGESVYNMRFIHKHKGNTNKRKHDFADKGWRIWPRRIACRCWKL